MGMCCVLPTGKMEMLINARIANLIVTSTLPILGDVDRHMCFRACNGAIVNNIFELESFLQGCSDYDFHYHVNKDHRKNDFATWIRVVIHDELLADKLQDIMDKEEYLRILHRRLEELSEMH